MPPTANTNTLLAAWEAGMEETPVQRALTLLALAGPDRSAGALARVSIGERDRRLLALREELFGSRLEATADCPRCGERLELNFRTEDARMPQPVALEDQQELRLEASGYEVRYRLPNSADLLEIGEATEEGREALLMRCIQGAQRDGAAFGAANLPDEVTRAVTEAMAQVDPQADVRVALACPACGEGWRMAFDILSHLWGEIDDWACRLLREVHALASAYGWSERDILALSAWRRSLYLELAGG